MKHHDILENNKMAVTAFLGQTYSASALHSYWDKYCTPTNLVCGKGDPTLVGDATTGTPGSGGPCSADTVASCSAAAATSIDLRRTACRVRASVVL